MNLRPPLQHPRHLLRSLCRGFDSPFTSNDTVVTTWCSHMSAPSPLTLMSVDLATKMELPCGREGGREKELKRTRRDRFTWQTPTRSNQGLLPVPSSSHRYLFRQRCLFTEPLIRLAPERIKRKRETWESASVSCAGEEGCRDRGQVINQWFRSGEPGPLMAL